MPTDQVLTVCVTGAAGQIAYSLLPTLVSGGVFGPTQKIRLHLLEIAPAMTALSGVVMELQDLASPLLESVLATSEPDEAFADCAVAVLVGAIPRGKGQARADLLVRNAPVFRTQGEALARVARPDVRVLVVGNPANTNALIISKMARIPAENVSALTMLDHNRTRGLVARKLGVKTGAVTGVCVWGNHSETQYPDVTRVTIASSERRCVLEELGGYDSIRSDFIPVIQKRGKAIIDARGLSSALSAAKAIGDHLRAWFLGSDEIVSMAIPSDGSYDVPPGIWCSYPVRCKGNFETEIVAGLQLDAFSQEYIAASARELDGERTTALEILKEEPNSTK